MGKLFDFNRDGERDFGESMLGLGLLGMIFEAAEQEELNRQAELEEEEDLEWVAR